MTPIRFDRRAALVALGAWPAFARAQAQAQTPPARRYAVLSLIGDEIGYVQRTMATGTWVGDSERQATPVNDAAVDGIAMSAAERALAEAQPAAERLRFSIRDKRLFALQERLLESTDGLRESLKALLDAQQVTHLLLVTKFRDDARFRLQTRWAGVGKLAGVGFYLDEYIQLRAAEDSSEVVTGFYGTYAYVRVSLVEAATMKPQAVAQATESDLASAIGSNAGRAWDAVDMATRAKTLQLVIDKAVYTATKKVVAST